MVFGNHAVRIRVEVPNLLISSNRRELVGGGLCSEGAERPGKVTIENGTEERCFSSSVSKSSRGSRWVFCSATETSTCTTSRGVPATCSCWVLATNTHLEKASSCREEWSGDKVGVVLYYPVSPSWLK